MDTARELPDSTVSKQTTRSTFTPREFRLQNENSHFSMRYVNARHRHPDPLLMAPIHSSRWWFVASIFPTIAGTLGPVALAFSICSLGRPWVQHDPNGTNASEAAFVPDPAWYVIIKKYLLTTLLRILRHSAG